MATEILYEYFDACEYMGDYRIIIVYNLGNVILPSDMIRGDMLNALKQIYEVCSQGHWVWGIGIALLLVVWKAVYKEFYGKVSLLGCLKDIWVREKDMALSSAKYELSGVPILLRIVAVAVYSVASYIIDLILFDQNKRGFGSLCDKGLA